MISLRPLDDLFVDGDRCAVMVDEQVVVLSELATTVVLALRAGPRDVEGLVALLVREYGDPATADGDATSLTLTVIDDLTSHGIVTA